MTRLKQLLVVLLILLGTATGATSWDAPVVTAGPSASTQDTLTERPAVLRVTATAPHLTAPAAAHLVGGPPARSRSVLAGPDRPRPGRARHPIGRLPPHRAVPSGPARLVNRISLFTTPSVRTALCPLSCSFC